MFPEELPRRILKLFTYRGDIAVDLFNGAGTTTLVAWRLRRRFIGIDLSRRYCEVAMERIRQEQAVPNLFEGREDFPFPPPELVDEEML